MTFVRPTPEELERSRIDRCLAGLQDIVDRCRTEDVRFGTAVYAPLSFLERRSDHKRPFEEFSRALDEYDPDPVKSELRWQTLKRCLDEIRRAVTPRPLAH